MNVLVTGAYGTCGTAIIDHLHEDSNYEFTYLNRSDRPQDHPYGDYDTFLGDVTDYEAIRPAFDGQDAVVHLAGNPNTGAPWDEIFKPNILGTYNVLEAAREASVESVIFASTNHVMGMYEQEFAPELYEPGHELMLDHTDPVRPDSYYGVSKSFGEDLGRYYAESDGPPERVYALRICSVRSPEYDHPYGDAERKVIKDNIERGSDEYDRAVARMKAMWQSRRDFTHQIDRCLRDDTVEFGIFNGVSDNDRRWFAIQSARDILGYDPQDNGEEWDNPPSK